MFRTTARRLTCHQPDDLGKGTTSVVPLRSHPRGHPEAAESPAKPETPNEGSLHQVFLHQTKPRGAPSLRSVQRWEATPPKRLPASEKNSAVPK